MLNRQRQRAAVLPLPALVGIGAVLLLLALSVVLQPPRAGGAGALELALAWGQAILFSAGSLAFLLALVVPSRAGVRARQTWLLPAAAPTSRVDVPFTLVALGVTAEDTRGIQDAADPEQAVVLLWQWSEEHPDERLVIFGPDGAVLAFRRPSRATAKAQIA